jgi:hypothetical protein
MDASLNAAALDTGLQRLQEVLLEEHSASLMRCDVNHAPLTSAMANPEGHCTLKLNAALAKIEELQSAVAQADLMKKASLNALRASQGEVSRLQAEIEARKQQPDEVGDLKALCAELERSLDSLRQELAESQLGTAAAQASLVDKDAELRSSMSRWHPLETTASFAPAEVARLTAQLHMRDEAASEESQHLKHLLACAEQSVADTRRELDNALRANILSVAEWRSRYDRKCDEHMKAIDELQQTIQSTTSSSRDAAALAIISECDRLRAACQESNEHAAALNLKVSHLQHLNAQLQQQLDTLQPTSPSPAPSTFSHAQVSVGRSSALSLEVQALKRELAEVRARASAVEHRGNGRSHEIPAFFISERQYSLLVEEHAQLLDTNSQQLQQLNALKQQLRKVILAQRQHDAAAAAAAPPSHAGADLMLDALFEFCQGLAQRLDSVERAVSHLQSSAQ